MLDKRMTEDEVVAQLRDGMTLGIGGWASRRKPMSLVRATSHQPLGLVHGTPATIARPSSTFEAIGFSTSTCTPRLMQVSAIS